MTNKNYNVYDLLTGNLIACGNWNEVEDYTENEGRYCVKCVDDSDWDWRTAKIFEKT